MIVPVPSLVKGRGWH